MKIPFARCADGAVRHVSVVPSGDFGPFVCLGCAELLVLRRPKKARAHFAHRADSKCSGETALHQYAKELLAREKSVTLPLLRLRGEEAARVVCEAGVYSFDEVAIEEGLGPFQPDAIVQLRGTALAVEFRVTHAVDEVKRAKVTERGVSMIEIDLSSIRKGGWEGSTLDHAILHTAPRKWIFHRHEAAAAKKQADEEAAHRAAKGARLKYHIQRKSAARPPAGWRNSAADFVRDAGLNASVGIEVGCAHWFAAPPDVWQAAALAVHIVEPAQQFSPGHELPLKGEWPNDWALATKLPAWMIRTDLSQYGVQALADAGYDKDSFGTADHAVWNYFAALVQRGECVEWNSDAKRFRVQPELHARLHRSHELRRRIMHLLEESKCADAEAECARWMNTPIMDEMTPAFFARLGGDGYAALSVRLKAVEAMTRYGSRQVADDLCGLPLDSLRQRQVQRAEEHAAERARHQQEAQTRRRRNLESGALQALGDEAAAWLAASYEGVSGALLEWASASDENAAQAQRWLRQAEAIRDRRLEAGRQADACRAKFGAAAERAFESPERAALFLNSAHPVLGGRRPADCCEGEHALPRLLALLPKRRS